jgi:pyruvate/2-oxoglutarate dehydrogenase complex dihydrolipoamide acyltransferase (E2) component
MKSLESLQIVATLSAKGELKIVHASDDRRAAIAAFEKAAADPKLLEVQRLRAPAFESRAFPSRNAQIRAERLAEKKALATIAAQEAAEALEATARGNASLAALELADINSIPLSGITGTGPGGQIITADIQPLIKTEPEKTPPLDLK